MFNIYIFSFVSYCTDYSRPAQYHSAIFRVATMAKRTKKPPSEHVWRLEIRNPLKSEDWRPLWSFRDDEKAAYERLRDNLNRINRPVLLRIASNTE